MSDTPETDALVAELEKDKVTVFDALVMIQAHARKLERERDDLQKAYDNAMALANEMAERTD